MMRHAYGYLHNTHLCFLSRRLPVRGHTGGYPKIFRRAEGLLEGIANHKHLVVGVQAKRLSERRVRGGKPYYGIG